MRYFQKNLLKIFSFLSILLLASCASSNNEAFLKRDLSSELTILDQPIDINGITVSIIDNQWYVIQADINKTKLILFNPPETENLRVMDLAQQENLSVIINAAMFAKDYKTSIGYMKNYQNINNAGFHPNMSSFLLFNPKKENLAKVKIGKKSELTNYHTAFQSYRMWSPSDGILWKKGAHYYYQVALVGTDNMNNLYFFFHPSRIDIYEYVEKILKTIPNLNGLLYLDGGSHGTLYLDKPLGRSWNAKKWSLPNLLGLRPLP
ncbi:MAG: hypothetical protein M9962_11970 [Oligoflexia bacterium]|nr:hypothetical protein [Oligoflexia bacterium]